MQRTEGQFLPKFYKCAYGWVRWFKELKQLVVEEMCSRGITLGFTPDKPAPASIVVAGYEADPKCVEVAHLAADRSIIFSNDGDLLVYPYANDTVVWIYSVNHH